MYYPCLHKNYLSHNFLPALRIYGSWKMTPGTIICIYGALCWGSYREKLNFWDFDFFVSKKSSRVTTIPANFSFDTHFVLKIPHWKYRSENVNRFSKPEFWQFFEN